MGRVNPAREFLRRIKSLCDNVSDLTGYHWDEEKQTSTEKHPDGNYYWPFGFSHDSLPKDCFKREDGLWEQNNKINTHSKCGGYVLVFLWRIHPSHRGIATWSEVYEKSEREKVLYETEDLEFVWRWEKVILPTECVWSCTMGPTFFEVRDKKTKQPLIQHHQKAPFIRAYNEMFQSSKK